ncbi:hypothetical protein TNCV_3413351 [Trichonephila clavipes]|uniref:Uncharacterized protein n=1 Tax=Trichonephila clavipes TaxID=2585209 RepID=A0A8X6UZU4_TRICX|nr:hypothetical protein TNCV_3413351 [Trichonephila clavipes]
MLLNVETKISASDYDWQAFHLISFSDFRRSVSIVGASGVNSEFNGDSDTDKCCVTGSRVFSLACPLGPVLMATLYQPKPRSEA